MERSSRFSSVEAEWLDAQTGVFELASQPIVDFDTTCRDLPLSNIHHYAFLAKEKGRQLASSNAGPLDAEEGAAVVLYTAQWLPKTEPDQSLYAVLNRALREKGSQREVALRPFRAYLKLLLVAIRKLPIFSGVVWRGMAGDHSSMYQQRKETGMAVYWWGFSSTMCSFDALAEFLPAHGERTLFNLLVKRGRIIGPYTDFPREAEVILEPATRSVVKNVGKYPGAGAGFLVELSEEPAPSDLLRLHDQQDTVSPHSIRSTVCRYFADGMPCPYRFCKFIHEQVNCECMSSSCKKSHKFSPVSAASWRNCTAEKLCDANRQLDEWRKFGSTVVLHLTGITKQASNIVHEITHREHMSDTWLDILREFPHLKAPSAVDIYDFNDVDDYRPYFEDFEDTTWCERTSEKFRTVFRQHTKWLHFGRTAESLSNSIFALATRIADQVAKGQNADKCVAYLQSKQEQCVLLCSKSAALRELDDELFLNTIMIYDPSPGREYAEQDDPDRYSEGHYACPHKNIVIFGREVCPMLLCNGLCLSKTRKKSYVHEERIIADSRIARQRVTRSTLCPMAITGQDYCALLPEHDCKYSHTHLQHENAVAVRQSSWKALHEGTPESQAKYRQTLRQQRHLRWSDYRKVARMCRKFLFAEDCDGTCPYSHNRHLLCCSAACDGKCGLNHILHFVHKVEGTDVERIVAGMVARSEEHDAYLARVDGVPFDAGTGAGAGAGAGAVGGAAAANPLKLTVEALAAHIHSGTLNVPGNTLVNVTWGLRRFLQQLPDTADSCSSGSSHNSVPCPLGLQCERYKEEQCDLAHPQKGVAAIKVKSEIIQRRKEASALPCKYGKMCLNIAVGRPCAALHQLKDVRMAVLAVMERRAVKPCRHERGNGLCCNPYCLYLHQKK